MNNNHISYVEFLATDLELVKEFYAQAFGWTFTDFGDAYTAFSDSGIEGGFEKVEQMKKGGALIVLYHTDLERIKKHIENCGGTITQDIFAFPGGRRFHFADPVGNELAVWSDK